MKADPRLSSAIGDFDSVYIGGDVYLLTPRPTAYLSGGAWVTIDAKLPIPHRLVRLHVIHRDSIDGSSSDSWRIFLRKYVQLHSKTDEIKIFDMINQTTVKEIEYFFPSNNIYGSSMYQFRANLGAATDRVYPHLYIQLLGDSP